MIALSDIFRASATIKGFVDRTPVIEDRQLAGPGNVVALKLESMQPTGSFKVRGAANKMAGLSPEQRAKGVVTFSSGNHGLAVAYMAKRMGISATVCMTNNVPEVKREAVERLGAEIVQKGSEQDEAEVYCRELARDKGMEIINPFDDAKVIAGQGTVGLELLEEYPDIESILVPLSGGGLASGVALAAKAINPAVRVIGVSMERAPAMYHSLKAGKPVLVQEQFTLADSLRGGIGLENQYTFDIVKNFVDDIVLVTEKEIASAIVYLLSEHRILAEGGASVGVAAILAGRASVSGKSAAVITGKNINMSWVKQILNDAPDIPAYTLA